MKWDITNSQSFRFIIAFDILKATRNHSVGLWYISNESFDDPTIQSQDVTKAYQFRDSYRYKIANEVMENKNVIIKIFKI